MANYNSPPNKRVPTSQELAAMVTAYEAGETTSEIARTVGASDGWVAARLKEHGLVLRRAGTRRTPVDVQAVVSAYVDRNQSMTAIANETGLPYGAIRKTLVDQGIAIRRVHAGVPCEDLQRLYVDEELSASEIGERYGLSRSAIYSAVARCGISAREKTPFDISNDELQTLLNQGLTDTEIAERYNVRAWNVRVRCREAGLNRAPGGRFESAVPQQPATLDLHDVYLTQQRSISAIATEHKVTAWVVKEWLAAAGIERRDAGRQTRPDHKHEIPVDELAQLYTHDEWTTDELAAHFGRSKKSVILALHHAGVPLRRSGAGGPRVHPVPLLTALYNDSNLRHTLRKHRIPIVETFGHPSTRFPTKPTFNEDILRALYVDHGLSITHIELLTGHTTTTIRRTAQTAGLKLRPGARSPWVTENLSGP